MAPTMTSFVDENKIFIVINNGVATIVQGRLFQGYFSPSSKIPILHYSKDTLFQERLYSRCDFIPRSHQSMRLSFQGDMTVENIPRSRIYSGDFTRKRGGS